MIHPFNTKIQHVYENNYKQLLIIPFIILLLALAQITYQTVTTGEFIHRGVSLKGGVEINIATDRINIDQFRNAVTTTYPNSEFNTRTITSITQDYNIEISGITQEQTIQLLKQQPSTDDSYTIQETGSALGKSFFRTTIILVLLSFIFMGIVVAIAFRKHGWAPSAAVVLCAFSDMAITIAVFNLLGQYLSLAGIAAFLMLIGYSVDTDILLSTRVLKRSEGTTMERIYDSIKTGLTMTLTTLTVLIVALFLVNEPAIRQIMIILLIGLSADIINTWIQNVGIIRIYLERKHHEHH